MIHSWRGFTSSRDRDPSILHHQTAEQERG
jgi:hypothetical protein